MSRAVTAAEITVGVVVARRAGVSAGRLRRLWLARHL